MTQQPDILEPLERQAADVDEALMSRRGRTMAYTTAMTLCKRMADRGVLSYVERDRAYIYSPAVKRKSILRRLLGDIADRVFSGSEAELALTVLADAKMDKDELAELKKLLAAKERELRTRSKRR